MIVVVKPAVRLLVAVLTLVGVFNIVACAATVSPYLGIVVLAVLAGIAMS